MGALKVKIDGVWTVVPVWAGEPVVTQSGTWTPTLTGMAIGTGGTPQNTAAYTYVGGPNVGDRGIMAARGKVRFGTTGATFPTAPTLTLPPGFNLAGGLSPLDQDNDGDHVIGLVTFRDDGAASYPGWICAAGTPGAFRPILDQTTIATHTGTVVAYATRATLSTTTPIAWGPADAMTWEWNAAVVRV